MSIEFDRSVDEARFKSPLEEFETVSEEIEHRSDPLTGRSVRVVPQTAPNPDPDGAPEPEIGDVAWIAPFAPLGQWHVAGVADATGLLDPEERAVEDVATKVANVLDYYAESGLNALNMGLRFARGNPTSRVAVDVLARPVFEDR